MHQTLKSNHFDTIATSFDTLWRFTDGYKQWMSRRIVNHLGLNQNDIFVDLGGGTGLYTKLIRELALPKECFCVEPSSQMIATLEDKNIQSINLDAISFSQQGYRYSKILLKEMVHFIDNRSLLFENIYKQLFMNGAMLIVTRPQKTTLPFFQKALQEFEKSQPDVQIFVNELELAGFSLKIIYDEFCFTISKTQWHEMLKGRFMSNLQKLSNKEIEDGIREIEFQELIDTKDRLVFIVAYKHNIPFCRH